MKRIFASALCLLFTAPIHAQITVDNCGTPLTLDTPPKTLITHDINMSEMAFALGLNEHMIGVTGISGYYKTTPAFKQLQGSIPELAPKYPSLEVLVNAKPDVFFAGWNYGMRLGGSVTPEALKEFGTDTLILNESCSHILKNKKPATMEQMFDDVNRLATLFGKQDKATQLITDWKNQLTKIQNSTKGQKPLKVFLYDSGEDKPFTAGKYAIVSAMIEAAGGENIMKDLDISWGVTSWESVALHNPDLIILLDYQNGTGAKGMQRFLEKHPAMKTTAAVKFSQYVPLRYEEITPGPANLDAIEKLAIRIQAINEQP
ncbi:putative ABC-type Fe3+-hydroxamate transport system, periplasmic component [Vibrio nigripulchritudo MADA3029]|uniref:ABC transporter substrate-binding protein n=1 Tax=Vibrio nigripulchritudo TaxID=28173 RepID=UPI0003B20022|nr:ABC transporter substrate-binding protein [Vibrio nigripulchritudo]CCN48051.1 putative ABC-type Fe3+-hydroxamate transport system, periplasmic component [Vibrio nigripulchritudo MADA3020]CCN52574.1 putative ABC-type Fe3+-hydroxamate transport system, periplasmic component [Vibrio nigripulchritudo MADA3021]CCN60077.1 putative ABC-type Fe3+-hydroxamate transport system, periplasmic component [Vibrio nigripulchritudo MADA3029]